MPLISQASTLSYLPSPRGLLRLLLGLAQLYGAMSSARVIFRIQGTAEAVWEMKHVSGADGWDDPRIRPLAW